MFVKLHTQIFDSSIMEEDIHTRYIWFCLLALADAAGFIDMTIPAIARRINVEESAVGTAINRFLQPDPTSRTPDHNGKRLEKIRDTFGWRIINYDYYRNIRNEEERRLYMRDYMKQYRKGKQNVNNVNSGKPPLAKAEAEAEAEANIYTRFFDELWKKYPNKDGKKAAIKHFKATVKSEKDVEDIKKALDNYLQSDRVKNGYVKNGSVWFNNWRDWIDNPVQKPKTWLDKIMEGKE